MIRYLSAALILLIFVFVACHKNPKRPLTSNEQRFIDSLYRDEVDTLKKQIDAWCEKNYDSIYQRANDSILDLRIREIMEIRNE